jgi:hypothetical protein
MALRVHSHRGNLTNGDLKVPEQNAVVAVYASHVEAEVAVKELQHAGVDMRTLSIVGKDSHADVIATTRPITVTVHAPEVVGA